MANKILIFENQARELGAIGQFFALKLIDGGAVYTMYLEALAQPPTQPALASQITATGVPIIAPSGAGDVIGIGTTNTLPLWTDGPNSVIGDSLLSQSSGNVVLANGNFVLPTAGLITFPDNVRQVFNPGATVAGLNVGAQAGDPSTPINGDIWYDSTGNLLRARINSATVSLGAVGATIALNNLASVAINTDLLPASTQGLGNASFPFLASFTGNTTQYESVVQTAGVITHAALGSATNIGIALNPKAAASVTIGGGAGTAAKPLLLLNSAGTGTDLTSGWYQRAANFGIWSYSEGGTLMMEISTVGLSLVNTKLYNFTDSGMTAQTALGQNAVGVLEINNGTLNTYRDLLVRKHFVDQTVTAGGTTGAQTINKAAGTVNIAAGQTAIVVTDSLVTTSSEVFAVIRTNDTTALVKNVVPGSGTFTITLNAAATAETSIGFIVLN
jgi:hypothetical protein